MGWTGGGQHTTTVLTINSDGSITVFDNENTVGDGPSFMSIHTVNYDTETIPTTITIFRLTTDHLYLIDGSTGGQILNGTPQYDNEIITSGETQIVNCGPHDDVVEITAASTGTMTVNGGGGQDTVVYTDLGVEGAAFFGPNGQPLTIVNGTIYTGEPVTVVWLGGSDTLNGISSVQFTDATIDITPCYCPGTLIKTPSAARRRLKNSRSATRCITMSGSLRPIKWIGRRSYGGRFLRGRRDVLPICIKAGALAENVPKRDLWISPHHAMYLDGEGVLIEAKDLINGVSVVQAEHVDGGRIFPRRARHARRDHRRRRAVRRASSTTTAAACFIMRMNTATLYADEWRRPACYCAPLFGEGYDVEAARLRLAQRAGLRGEPKLRGRTADWRAARLHRLHRCDEALPAGRRIAAHLKPRSASTSFVHAKLVGRVLANSYRDDLAARGPWKRPPRL